MRAVLVVALVQERRGVRLRMRDSRRVHSASHASIHGAPDAGADARQEGGAERRAFFGGDDFDGLAVDVGLNLAPERRARASAAEPDARTGTCSSSKIVNVSRRLNATPSITARITWPRPWLAASPTSAARIDGSQCGVRSPIR